MWQLVVTAEGVDARYRRNVNQYLLLLMYTFGGRSKSSKLVCCKKFETALLYKDRHGCTPFLAKFEKLTVMSYKVRH